MQSCTSTAAHSYSCNKNPSYCSPASAHPGITKLRIKTTISESIAPTPAAVTSRSTVHQKSPERRLGPLPHADTCLLQPATWHLRPSWRHRPPHVARRSVSCSSFRCQPATASCLRVESTPAAVRYRVDTAVCSPCSTIALIMPGGSVVAVTSVSLAKST